MAVENVISARFAGYDVAGDCGKSLKSRLISTNIRPE